MKLDKLFAITGMVVGVLLCGLFIVLFVIGIRAIIKLQVVLWVTVVASAALFLGISAALVICFVYLKIVRDQFNGK